MTLTLPPPQYARKGGEVIAAQLAKVGIVAKIENVEWAQWLRRHLQGQLRPDDHQPRRAARLRAVRQPGYYWGYDSKAFRDLAAKHAAAVNPKERAKLFGDLQRLIANDAVNAFIFNPAQVAVAKKGLKGLWASSPIFANDLAAVSWQ